MYIDGDTHYWPLRMLDRVSHPGKGAVQITTEAAPYSQNGVEVGGAVATYYRDGEKVHSFREGRWNLEARYAWMDRDGFDIQVLIPDNRPLIYELDPALGRQLARAYNDTVAEDIAGKERFIGVAWVYLPDVAGAVREVRRAVDELGLRAVKVMGGFGDVDLDSEALWPFYEEVARLDIPILVHPAARSFQAQHCHPWLVGGERFLGYQMFPTALGFPFTYMLTAARLIFSGVLDRFPTLRFAFFEGGVGWTPWLMEQLDHHLPGGEAESARREFFRGRRPLQRAPSAYFSQLYIAAVAWERTLADTARRWPDHNIIIGSDFDHGDAIATWPNTVEPVKALGDLSEEDKARVLGGNARRLFNL